MYEIMRTLFDVIKESREDFRKDERLLRGMFSLGWCCLRPDYEQKRLVDCTTEKWCEGWKLGTHRMRQSWFEGRFSHIDEHGKPQPRFQECDENGFTVDTEQTYMVKEGETRTLESWKKMLEDGEINEE